MSSDNDKLNGYIQSYNEKYAGNLNAYIFQQENFGFGTYCTDLGYDYLCNEPLVRVASNTSGPVCGNWNKYIYDPANCDPGYWCGCSSTVRKECIPSNNLSATHWFGYFTTIDTKTGQLITLSGHGSRRQNRCVRHYMCPGRALTERCPDLCPPGLLCSQPDVIHKCPDGYYCPIASAEPKECTGLQQCKGEGSRRFQVNVTSCIMVMVAILGIVYPFAAQYFLIRTARHRKLRKMRYAFEDEVVNDDEKPLRGNENSTSVEKVQQQSVVESQQSGDLEKQLDSGPLAAHADETHSVTMSLTEKAPDKSTAPDIGGISEKISFSESTIVSEVLEEKNTPPGGGISFHESTKLSVVEGGDTPPGRKTTYSSSTKLSLVSGSQTSAQRTAAQKSGRITENPCYAMSRLYGSAYARSVAIDAVATSQIGSISKREETRPEESVNEQMQSEHAAFTRSELMSQARAMSSRLTPPGFTVDIEFERLRLEIPGVGCIMRGVSGRIKSGNLTAVMGPSGAGKTTFLSLMSGKVDRTRGVIKINGQEGSISEYRRVTGYVPQDDIMHRELTVEEIVTHSAMMRLPLKWSKEEKLARVDEILEILEIEHIRDSVIGDEKRRGISGGQRKRVNIAMEMVTKPSLLCLDEPTSGLDSTTSFIVVDALKNMAASGANVITVLHQPKFEIFALFDYVLLLGAGGMTVYYGPSSGMENYFSRLGFPCPPRSNPADFYMDVLSGIIPHPSQDDFDREDLFEAWMTAEENEMALEPEAAAIVMEEVHAEDAESSRKAHSRREPTGATKPFQLVAFVIKRTALKVVMELTMVWNHLPSNFRADKTNRKVPNAWQQIPLLFYRASLQRCRKPFGTMLDLLLMLVAGAIIPGLIGENAVLYAGITNELLNGDEDQQAYLRLNAQIVDANKDLLLIIYLVVAIVSCRSINVMGGGERVVFFRDSSSNQYVFSYWVAKVGEVWLWLPIYVCAFCALGYTKESFFIQSFSSYWTYIFVLFAGFYGIGILCSLLVDMAQAALLALVASIIIVVGFSATINNYGDSNMQTFILFWWCFWCTQGLCAQEYLQYSDAFNTTRLNELTPGVGDSNVEFGAGVAEVGAGQGSGFDLTYSYAENTCLAAVTAFAWYILVLWTLKTKDHRKHR